MKNEFNVIFTTSVNEALKAAKAVPDAGKRAEVYASIALALAQTGLVTGNEVAEPVAHTGMGSEDVASMERAKHEAKTAEAAPKKKPSLPKTEKADKAEKADKKADAKKALKPAPDKTSDDEVKEEVKVWTDEWTDEALEFFSEELATLESKMELYGDDLNDVISEWSSNKYNSPDELNPLNIRAFLTYLESLENSLEEEAVG